VSTFLSIVSVVLALLGTYIVAMNWGCFIVTYHNQRRGIDRHHSTVPIIAQLLLAGACYLSSLIPHWVLWSIALCDISILFLLYFLIRILLQSEKPPTTPESK